MSGFMDLTVWQDKAVTVVDDRGNETTMPEGEYAANASEYGTPIEVGALAWWANYSANGYMDRTDTVGPCATMADAAVECFQLYGEEGLGCGVTDDERELSEIIGVDAFKVLFPDVLL